MKLNSSPFVPHRQQANRDGLLRPTTLSAAKKRIPLTSTPKPGTYTPLRQQKTQPAIPIPMLVAACPERSVNLSTSTRLKVELFIS